MSKEPFRFNECMALLKVTGRKAGDVIEFVEILETLSDSVIFHHMHQSFLRPHVKPPEFTNDFAVWAAEALEEKILAERLANINPFEYAGISQIKSEIIRIITGHLKEYPAPRPVIKGKEFFFAEGVTIVLPSGHEVTSLEGFLEAVKTVDSSSIYFHFYEARLRLGKAHDDFSRFLTDCFDDERCKRMASAIRSLDPYMYTTEMLRGKLVGIIEKGIRGVL